MTKPNSDSIASKKSWKISPLPESRAALDFCANYSIDDFKLIQRGLIPHDMEDKWFIFFEEPWLFFHRSWSGFCIYGVRFSTTDQGVFPAESWVSRDLNQYKGTDTTHDLVLLTFLINRMLLNRSVSFPG